MCRTCRRRGWCSSTAALPPADTAAHAAGHDDALAVCLSRLLAGDGPGGRPALEGAELGELQLRRAQLPLVHGGLGLRAARRERFAAHWASWADCLPVLRARLPALGADLLAALNEGGGGLPCVAQAVQAASTLPPDFHRPTWQGLWDGAAPGQGPGEPGDFLRGWQKEATSLTDEAARDTLFSDLDLASRALLLSQAGPQAGRALHVLRTAAELRLPSDLLRIVLLRRLRMPLPAAARACRCGRPADALGDHVTVCPTSGVLRTRAVPLERAVARVCREAGGRVAMHVRVAEMNVDVPVSDARCIEILASALPVWHGAQVAIDTTLVSPIGKDGQPRGRSAREAGGVLEQAARRKRETTYPELLAARRCRLVVFGVEVGGRWNGEARELLRALARAKARERPQWLRASAVQAFHQRWSGIIAVAAQRALAATLAGLPGACLDALDGTAPPWPEVLAAARLGEAEEASRLPLRAG